MTTRRDFLKASLAASAGSTAGQLTGLLHASGQAAAPPAPQEWRNRQPEMGYRRLGRTGFMISEIVCGGDPISPTNNRHVELAIDVGLNYLDTAPGYHDGQSEMGYAKVIEVSKRDRVFLTTKVSPFCPSRIDAYRKIFPRSAAMNRKPCCMRRMRIWRSAGPVCPIT
jgi:hypothetical protein